MQQFDVITLGERTGIAPERLRYCIEQGLTERDWFVPEDGARDLRLLYVIAGVHVTCAALLFKGGCSRESVKALMRTIGGFQRYRRNPLNLPLIADAIEGTARAAVQVADGTHVRWRIGTDDTGWFRFTPVLAAEPDYDPLFVIALNVARIRDLVKGDPMT